MREFFVIDGRGFPTLDHDNEPQSFGSMPAAARRARIVAKSEPGETVVIAQAIAYVTCEVAAPKLSMKERKLRSGGRKHGQARHAHAR